MNLRASSLPLISKCSAAARPPQTAIVYSGEPADLGSAVHEALANHVRGWASDLDEIAERYDVDRDELGFLTHSGRNIWERLKDFFPSPEVEAELEVYCVPGDHAHYSLDEDLRLSGHPDVFSLDGTRANVLDWKGGRLDLDHTPQMKGYALLILDRNPEVQEVWAGVARLREGTIDGTLFSREQIETWWAGLVEEVQGAEKFTPGEQCGFCPRGHECPAKLGLLSQTAEMMTTTTEWPAELYRTKAVSIYDGIKLLEPYLEHARELLKAEVVAAGGRLPLGDGRTLVLTDVARKQIDYGTGEEILCEALGDDVSKVLTVSKTKVEELVKERAPYRGKGKAVKELMERLDEAGAITITTKQKLECKRDVSTSASTTAIGDDSAAAGPVGIAGQDA